ncbi:MAG: hypothetical protein KJN80_01465, partial [Deltaproteobacteria bacterium]|nr:hypothetical protein [Deltaproteobacteria bacterium]
MLCDVEKTPHENIIDLEKLQENNHNGENITSVLLGVEQNSYGNEEKPLIPMIAETDKNTTATASKPEIELSLKKSAPGDILDLSGMTDDDKSSTWQGKLNKNNTRFQITNGIKEDIGNEVKAQLLNGLEAQHAKMIRNPETSAKNTDGRNQ